MNFKIYWAAPLFTQAERIWNRQCVARLRGKGHSVVLPQDDAKQFETSSGIDAIGIARHCYERALECDVMIVILDGADSDSGTSLEAGLKLGHRGVNARGKVIGVRTDFRASEDGQLNAMFRLLDEVVRFPSFNEDLEALCEKIHESILRHCGGA